MYCQRMRERLLVGYIPNHLDEDSGRPLWVRTIAVRVPTCIGKPLFPLLKSPGHVF